MGGVGGRIPQTTFGFDSDGGVHLFTPREASNLLPEVRNKMKQLMQRKKVVDRLRAEIERYNLIGLVSREQAAKGRELDNLAEEMMKGVGELEDLGVTVRDLDLGLIDFPAKRYGERVFLCWRFGEPDVAYWHREEEGFNGRKVLNSQLVSP